METIDLDYEQENMWWMNDLCMMDLNLVYKLQLLYDFVHDEKDWYFLSPRPKEESRSDFFRKLSIFASNLAKLSQKDFETKRILLWHGLLKYPNPFDNDLYYRLLECEDRSSKIE